MIARAALFVAFALTLGCRPGEPAAVQVSGTLKHADGTPVAGESGTIVFQPVGEGQPASGAVAADGSYKLMTRKPGDGVAPGKYKVVLKVWKNYRDQTLAVPERYGDAATTPLEGTTRVMRGCTVPAASTLATCASLMPASSSR